MTHTPLSALRRIFAYMVAGGPCSLTKPELVKQYGEYSIGELLKAGCLSGQQHLSLTEKGAHCALIGRID